MEDFPDDTYQAMMSFKKGAKRILILAADKMEDLSFFYPYYRFIEEGWDVDVATPDGGAFRGERGLGLQMSLKIANIKADSYDLLYISGGQAAKRLAADKRVLDFIGAFVTTGNPVAAACYAPLVLAAADVIGDRRIAAWPTLQAEIEEAGAVFVSKKTVCDGPFLTARWPADMPALVGQIMETLKERRGSSSIRSAA